MKVHSDKKKRTIVISDKWSETETMEAITHLTSVFRELKRNSGDPKNNTKLFDINWNSFDDVNELFLKLQGRRQQLKKEMNMLTKPSASEIYSTQWDAIQRILDCDISFLYENSLLDGENKYYVYAHCDTSQEIKIHKKNVFHIFSASLGMKYLPFYIGKGTGDRYIKGDRNRNYSKVANKKVTEVDKIILKDGLTESEALQLESKLIDIFGLSIHRGFLVNIDEGVNKDHRRFCYQNELNILRKIEKIL